mmetsp:Transcript_16348/g.22641  ORF Transcript_16348/g.22641 Transcript_16348/m.22641 type:complete len:331 (-) Transcript_16348:480-1472(-)
MDKCQMIQKGERTIKYAIREREILSSLKHPFICNLLGALQDTKNLYLVLDLMMGGELQYHVQRGMSEDAVRFYVSNILLGLEHLKSKRIIHRDLKPANVLMDDSGYVSLTDFNVAIELPEGKEVVEGKYGTYNFMPPEMFRKEEYSYDADIWGLGVIIYYLLFGRCPYDGEKREWGDEDVEEIRQKITQKMREKFSEDCVDFVAGLLCLRAQRRTLEQCKEHDWMKPIDFDLILAKEESPPIRPALDHTNVDGSAAVIAAMEGALKDPKGFKLTEMHQQKFVKWNWLPDVVEDNMSTDAADISDMSNASSRPGGSEKVLIKKVAVEYCLS